MRWLSTLILCCVLQSPFHFLRMIFHRPVLTCTFSMKKERNNTLMAFLISPQYIWSTSSEIWGQFCWIAVDEIRVRCHKNVIHFVFTSIHSSQNNARFVLKVCNISKLGKWVVGQMPTGQMLTNKVRDWTNAH